MNYIIINTDYTICVTNYCYRAEAQRQESGGKECTLPLRQGTGKGSEPPLQTGASWRKNTETL